MNYFVKGLMVVLLCLGISCSQNTAQQASSKQPNIIWLVAEDQSPQWFPMYGDSTIALPNLQSLSEDAVIFDNAYSPVPVCAPARSAIITGMYPTTLGTHNMRTYAAWRGEDNEPSIGIPNYSPLVPQGVKMFTEYLREEGYYCANGPKEDYNFEKTDGAWDESSPNRHWRKRGNKQPFFAVFNFSICHESQIWNRGNDSLFVSPDKVVVPPYLPDNKVVRHDLAVNYSNLKRLDEQIGLIISELKKDGLYEDSYIFFYGDHGGPFPRHKRALYETGTKVPMVIKFPNQKEAGTRDDRFLSFIDLAPSVLSLAGIEPPKVMQGVAQFGEYEVKTKPNYVYFTSDRFDEKYDRLRAIRSENFKYIYSYDTTISHAMEVSYREQMPMMQNLRELYKKDALNKEQALWLQPSKPQEELYDLKKDPFELNNLASNPAYQDSLNSLRKLLKTWIRETKDLGKYPENELIAKWLINEEQPRLGPLELMEKGDQIELISHMKDATILWKVPKDSIWMIYNHPLPRHMAFEAKAERIGYSDSDILYFDPR
ncbi:MAG: sulfatase [Eudoraea sp.]|uniref:sulfatase family protein n=1 Tax=Eudoraea sp. TaxID=1979955 RepID=UPI003C748F0D